VDDKFFPHLEKNYLSQKDTKTFSTQNKTQVFSNRFLYFLNAFFVTLVHKSRIKNNELFKKSTLKKTFLITAISTWAGLGDARWSLALGRDIFPGLI